MPSLTLGFPHHQGLCFLIVALGSSELFPDYRPEQVRALQDRQLGPAIIAHQQ